MAINSKFIFYEGKEVFLKVLVEEDILESGWMGWFNDEKNTEYTSHHYYPNTTNKQKKYLESCSGPDIIALGIVDKRKDDRVCGIVTLSSINFINRNCEISGIMDRSSDESRPALFIEAWSIALRHAFQQLGMYKVYGGTFHPHVAGALKRIFNFEEEGVRKEHVYKNGVFHDVTLLAVFGHSIIYPEV